MNIFKVTHIDSGKVYVGYSMNDNPNFLGSGKYVKRAVRDFGTEEFTKEILEEFPQDTGIDEITDRVEYWIKKFKSDDFRYGYNESIIDLIPKKKRLTKKLQVLLSNEDEDALNTIIIQKSMERGIRPTPISKYVRQLIVEHIVDETSTDTVIKNLKNKLKK